MKDLGQSNGLCDVIDFVLLPVIGLGDLLVQGGSVFPDELAFLFSDLFFDQRGGELHRIIEDIGGNAMLVPFCLGKDTVLAFTLCFDADPMLRQTAEHVFAFAYVDDLAVDLDTVNAWMFKLLVPALPFQHGIDVVFIRCVSETMIHGIPPYS